MRKIAWLLWLGIAGACGVESEAPGAPGAPDDPPVSAAEQASYSYYPMGFARVTAAGAVFKQFNKTGGAVTATHSTGNYTVTFAGLGILVGADSSGGHVQVSAEGAGNVRCRIINWSGAPNLNASVQCNAPDGTLADSAFTVLFFRYAMPAPTTWAPDAAYTWVTAAGVVSTVWDYNASGTHNTVTKTGTGSYTVTIANATAVNASMMISSYGGAAGTVCSISSWGTATAWIACRDRSGAPIDSAFSFSYSITGPTRDQQGGHAWFDGTSASSWYSSALGKIELCSPASVSGSRAGSLATVVVSGDLGPWDATPFVRASLVSKYGGPGYCKVESLSSVEGSPSTATTTVRCYDPTGAVVATPQFTLTHVTSDAAGPC